MSVVIASSVVLTSGDDINSNNPIIGYQNLVTSGNLSATSEQTNYPVVNLVNPSTASIWKPIDADPIIADQYLRVNVDTSDDVDYIAIARHNLSTAQCRVSVEVLYTDPSPSPEVWTEVISETLLPSDGPALFRFDPSGLFSVRLRIQPSDTALGSGEVVPFVGALYVGKLLVLQRRVYVGHTPITLGRRSNIINGRSESGHFLGRIQTGGHRQTTVSLDNLTASWYRQYFDPFVEAVQNIPFFFAWRPGSYPNEVGYAWTTNDIVPENSRSNGMMKVSMDLRGII